jgi:hypothetical protein
MSVADEFDQHAATSLDGQSAKQEKLFYYIKQVFGENLHIHNLYSFKNAGYDKKS